VVVKERPSVLAMLVSVFWEKRQLLSVLYAPRPPPNIGDLAFLEKAVADHVQRPLILGVGKQPDRRIDMGQVMFRLRGA
jgi:hypothetical protein